MGENAVIAVRAVRVEGPRFQQQLQHRLRRRLGPAASASPAAAPNKTSLAAKAQRKGTVDFFSFSVSSKFKNVNVQSIFIDANGEKYFGSRGGTITKFNDTSWTTVDLPVEDNDSPVQEWITVPSYFDFYRM